MQCAEKPKCNKQMIQRNFRYETVYCVAQAGLEFGSFHLSLLSAGFTSVYHHLC